MNRAKFDRMVGMLLTDGYFAEQVFADPQGVLSELGFSQEEIDMVSKFPQEKFKSLAATLDTRLTRNKRTCSKKCFEDQPPV
jgi:hypothetical protein